MRPVFYRPPKVFKALVLAKSKDKGFVYAAKKIPAC